VQNETQSTTTKSGVETKTREHDTRKENEKDNDQTPEKHATREKSGIRKQGDPKHGGRRIGKKEKLQTKSRAERTRRQSSSRKPVTAPRDHLTSVAITGKEKRKENTSRRSDRGRLSTRQPVSDQPLAHMLIVNPHGD